MMETGKVGASAKLPSAVPLMLAALLCMASPLPAGAAGTQEGNGMTQPNPRDSGQESPGTADVRSGPARPKCPPPPEGDSQAQEPDVAETGCEQNPWLRRPESGFTKEALKPEGGTQGKATTRRACHTRKPPDPLESTPDQGAGVRACGPGEWFGEGEGNGPVEPEKWFGEPRATGGTPKKRIPEGATQVQDRTAGSGRERNRRLPAKAGSAQTVKASEKDPGHSARSGLPGKSATTLGKNRLQPTSAWIERESPENWFREAPVVKPPAEQATTEYPKLFGYSELNLEYDTTVGESFDDTLVNLPSDIIQKYNPNLFLSAHVRFVFDGEDDGLRTYDTDFPFDGVYIRRLKLQKETQKYALFGGKFEPGYRIFSYAPIFFGNYSTDFNLEERAGLGGSVFLDKTENTEQRLTAQAFYLDKSRLSGEIFSGKARDGITNGQIGDTGQLNNFLFTYHGGVTNWDPGLRYSIGVGLQKPGDDVEYTERALLGSFYNIHRMSGGGDLEFSVDLLNINNADGYNQDTDSITLGGGYSDWPAYAGLAYSLRNVDNNDDGTMRTDRIVEIVLRKGITEQTLVEAAYQYSDENNEVQKNLGIVFRYYTDWSFD